MKRLTLGALVAASLMLAMPATAPSVDTTTRVTQPAPANPDRAPAGPTEQQKQLQAAEAQRIRVRRVKVGRPMWDGKNRSPGDRAHKRLKAKRRSGRK